MILKIIFVILCLAGSVSNRACAQDVALKTNALYWMTTTTNAAAEIALSNKATLELSVAYNPWTFKDNKKLRFLLVQPEARYWMCEKFEGHFVGFHAHAAQFYSTLANRRRDGYLAGAGFSYGYDWILKPNLNLEAELGVGYAHLWYKESDCIPCIKKFERKHKNYVGPTRAAVSLVYFF